MYRSGHQGIEETAAQPSCSFLTSGDARGRSGVRVSPPGCREPSGLLPTRRWSPRTGLTQQSSWSRRRQVRASSFSPAVPPACHKQRSPAVSSGQSRSLRGGRWAGRASLTWDGEKAEPAWHARGQGQSWAYGQATQLGLVRARRAAHRAANQAAWRDHRRRNDAACSSVGPDRELVGPLVAQHELAVPAGDVQHQPPGDSLALVQRQLIKVEERVEPAPGDFP